MAETIHIPEIGDVTFKHHHSAKSIFLKVTPLKGVTVTLPRHAKVSEGVEFVIEKSKWIKDKQKKAKVIEQNQHKLSAGKISKTFTLQLIPSKVSKISIKQDKRSISLIHPDLLTIDSDEIQQSIRYISEHAYKIEAKEYLPKRTAELAKLHNLSYQSVGITSAKTRWGSCSGINKINYSFYLMTLPNHLIDYVILHELAHTVYRDHGVNFWKLLRKMCPLSDQYSNDIKKYRTEV